MKVTIQNLSTKIQLLEPQGRALDIELAISFQCIHKLELCC